MYDLLVITGPTATGKTALGGEAALTLAEAEDRLADPCVRKQLELLRLRATHPAFGADSVGTVKAEGNGLTLAWQKGTDRVALEVDFRDGAWRIIQ